MSINSFDDLIRILSRTAHLHIDPRYGVAVAVSDVQWGDCGKAAALSYVCELLCADDYPFVAARFNGGSNAGHTVVINGIKFVTHMVPVSVLYGQPGLIGPNCVILPFQWGERCPSGLREEVEALQKQGINFRKKPLIVDPDASITCPWHLATERMTIVSGGGIGSTGRGIAPTYEDIAGKRRITVSDCLDELRLNKALLWGALPHITNHEVRQNYVRQLIEWGKWLQSVASIERADDYLANWQRSGRHILLEGAQGALLDPLRSQPCSTSSSPWPPLGIGRLRNVIHIGVFKLVPTRVGDGPFPTEIFGEEAERLRKQLGEYGSTTGRPRRIGMPDIGSIREGCSRLGVDVLCLTKSDLLVGEQLTAYRGVRHTGSNELLDWWTSERDAWDKAQPNQLSPDWRAGEPFQLPMLDKPFAGGQHWHKLPRSARQLVRTLEWLIQGRVPIAMMKTGPGSRDMVVRRT